MDSCTNQDLGRLLPFYELEALSPEDALKFEEHLLVCPYCSHELEAAHGFSKLLRANRLGLQEHYRQHETGFDAEVRRLEHGHAGSSWTDRVGELSARLREWSTGKRMRWSLVPALVVAVAALIFFVRPQENRSHADSLLDVLPSSAIPYNKLTVRGETAADSALESIMGSYEQGNYREATNLLQKYVELFPEHPQGWIYLGATRYMLQDFESASKALEKAERLTPGVALDPNVELYHAAALIQLSNADSARVVLKKLRTNPNKAVARQAQTILERLGPP